MNRVEASLKYGPAAVRRFDSTPYKERLQRTKQRGKRSTEGVLYRAALRRAEAAAASKAQQIAAVQDIEKRVASAIELSKARSLKTNTATAGVYQRVSDRTNNQRTSSAERRAASAANVLDSRENLVKSRETLRTTRLGANAYQNPAFINPNGQGAASTRNYMEGRGAPSARGATTGPTGPLESYKAQGYNLTTAKGTQSRFSGFLNALAATGYKIKSVGTYANRNATGLSRLSEHAYGNAIDVNPAQNPLSDRLITDMPKNIVQIAGRYGLVWGGTWKSRKDPMHFSTTGY